jgi:MFS family permease
MLTRSHFMFINLAHFAVHYLLLIFPTAVLAIQKDWRWSYSDTLGLGAAGLVVFALATLPVGWLGDRVPRNRLMAAFFLGGGTACALTGLAPDKTWLTLGLAGIGLFAAIYHPIGLAMIAERPVQQGKALAINGVFGNLGLSGATIGTGLIAGFYGWRAAFVVPGIAVVLAGILYLVLFGKEPKPSSQKIDESSARQQKRSSQFYIVILIAASALFGGFIFNGVTVSLPKVIEERILDDGMELQWVGILSAVIFAVAAFAQLPVGAALDRFGAKPVLLMLLGIQCAVMLALANAHGAAVFTLFLILVTAMFAEIPVTSWLLARFVVARWRSRAYAMEYVFSLGVSSLVIPLIAQLHQGAAGFRSMFMLLAGAAAIVAAVALFLPDTSRRATASLPVST